MIRQHKVVAALPAQLEKDSIYYVRKGSGFDLYVTNSSGTIVAYPANRAGLPSVSLVGIAESAPETLDFDFLTLTLDRDLEPGATFEVSFVGTQSQAAISQSLSFYVKINGGAAVTVGSVGTGLSLQNYRAISGRALLTFQKTGAAGSYYLGGSFLVNSLSPFSSNSASPRTADARAGMTITIGVRCSVANAANINRITCAIIKQVV